MSNIKEKLKKHFEQEDISMTSAARAIGYSASAISSWMLGKYDGDEKAVEDAVKRFLDRQSERRAIQEKPIPFVKTSVVAKVHETADKSLISKWLCVCYGAAGLGKTDALRAYATTHPEVILVETSIGMNARALLSEISGQVGLDGSASAYEMFREIVKKMKGTDYVLVIDEAENLAYKSLEYVRRIHDMSKIGILLVGMPKLIMNLRGRHGQYAQLYSRMRKAVQLDALNGMDVHDIVEGVFPNSNGIWKAFYDASKGNARVLSNLIENARDVARFNKIPITPDVVQETAKMLLI